MFTLKKQKIIDDEIGTIVKRDLTGKLVGEYFLYGEDRTCLPKHYDDWALDIENFEIRNDDIIVASFPKSGTTWAQEMVWLIKNKLDFKKAEVNLVKRFPMIEMAGLYDSKSIDQAHKLDYLSDSVNFIKNTESPRFIKTHLPFSLLPKQIRDGSKSPKIIYIMRNSKDCYISYFHMGNAVLGWHVNKENFAKAFLADKVMYAPYWKHVLGFYNMKHMSNFLIIKYEDMHRDLKSVIQQVCAFLEVSPLTNEELEQLCEHLSFESMRKNKAVNMQMLMERRNCNASFIRAGKVGEHKEVISKDVLSKFDDWIKQNIADTDFDVD